jgi:hypothetical protein
MVFAKQEVNIYTMYIVFHSRILFSIHNEDFKRHFKNIQDALKFPWIENSMFGYGHTEKSYGDNVVSFGATYKYNDEDTIKLFILRIESILR